MIYQLQKKKLSFPECDMYIVFIALLVTKISYALPTFYNHPAKHNKNQISALLEKAK